MQTRMDFGTFSWIDLVTPSEAELKVVAETYQIHPLLIQDCLEPEHLPKFEELENGFFVILRAYDTERGDKGMTVQEMTRKVAIFVKGNFLITIHRSALPFLSKLQEDFKARPTSPDLYVFLADLCKRSILTYDRALEMTEVEMECLEDLVSGNDPRNESTVKLHVIRRRLLCMKRLSWHLTVVFQRIPFPKDKKFASFFTDLREEVESFAFFADEFLDDATSLANLEIALASRRVNEIIRVLTLFSVFFMPLTFIVGVYGMNFKHMPELDWALGYPFAWGVMIATTLAIFAWFRHKKWV